MESMSESIKREENIKSDTQTSNILEESSTSKNDETPEEIRQYVKQFKIEVEDKFEKSRANQEFRLIKDITSSDKEESLASLKGVERYDLGSQNFFNKYNEYNRIDDPEKFAQILIEIGNIDKVSLESQLKNKKNQIIEVLMKCLRGHFEDEYSKRKEEKIEVYKKKLEAYKEINNKKINYGSNEGLRNQTAGDSSDIEIKKLSARTVGKVNGGKRAFEYGSLDKHLIHRFSKYGEKSGSKSTRRNHLESKINMKSVGNLKKRVGSGTISNHSQEGKRSNGNGKSSKMKLFKNIKNNLKTKKGIQSPKKKLSNKSKHISIKNIPGAHYFNKNSNSPIKPAVNGLNSKTNSKINVSKRSNLTLFTNNTLTSTLSPKSNISLSTLKSNSRSRGKLYQQSVLAANLKGKKSELSNTALLQFKVGNQLLSKIQNNNSNENSDALRSITPKSQLVKPKNLKKYGIKKKEEKGKNQSHTKRGTSKRKHLGAREAVLNALGKKKRDSKKEKSKIKIPTGIAQITSKHQHLHSLSNVNWRRRLENLL